MNANNGNKMTCQTPSGTLDFTPHGELIISPCPCIYSLVLCLRNGDSGLLAWMRHYFINIENFICWLSRLTKSIIN